jgi:hypothetical protein
MLSLRICLEMDRLAGEADEPKANRLGVVWQKHSASGRAGSDAGEISVSGNSNNETTNRVEDAWR